MTSTPRPPFSSRPLKKRKVSLGSFSSPFSTTDLSNYGDGSPVVIDAALSSSSSSEKCQGRMKCVPFSKMDQQHLDAAAVLTSLTDIFVPTGGVSHSVSPDFLPCFQFVVNFPQNAGKPSNQQQQQSRKLPDLSNCVMCNKECKLGLSRKRMSTVMSESDSESSNALSSACFIPRQNKGLCTECDSVVWVMVDCGKKIKWCKGCKNFRLLAAFGGKERATKCTKCRNRQRENYANQKEARLKQDNRQPSPATVAGLSTD